MNAGQLRKRFAGSWNAAIRKPADTLFAEIHAAILEFDRDRIQCVDAIILRVQAGIAVEVDPIDGVVVLQREVSLPRRECPIGGASYDGLGVGSRWTIRA